MFSKLIQLGLIITALSLVVAAQTGASGVTRPRVVNPVSVDPNGSASSDGIKTPRGETTSSILSRQSQDNAAPKASLVKLRQRLTEAERLFKTRPVRTSYADLLTVRLAILDPVTTHISTVTLAKDTFLTKGAQVPLVTSRGSLVELTVVRANGVNTAVTVFDRSGRSLTPLLVEYPIERNGSFRETAYYTSVHPALISADVVRAGQAYVHSMVQAAAKKLKDRGVTISPAIVEMAEKLCVLEHVDHDRFRKENRIALFNEVYALYALNEGDTYKYSVSFAGAGGMVQMIPWTYQMIRQRHANISLSSEFVAGMRNHGNAITAMLLYMQDTWNELSSNDDVMDAIASRQATVQELLAAGYNSNPSKLPSYIRRGDKGWRSLLPRETQMYLQIFSSYKALIPANSRG
jgi:hypothetical protein